METEFGTMKPKQVSREEREAAALDEKKKNLENQSAFLGVSNSEAHKVLLDLVSKKLLERIQKLCVEDQEAALCIKIMSELGLQKGCAELAAKELEKIYLKNK